MNLIAAILDSLLHGVDPTTGEVFSKKLFKDDDVRNMAFQLLSASGVRVLKWEPDNPYGRPVDLIFEDLKACRTGVAMQLGIPAYYVFNNDELMNIAISDVVDKEDLLKVKGIGKRKFERYGNEVYQILKPYIESDNRN